jgi:hypothetical protein
MLYSSSSLVGYSCLKSSAQPGGLTRHRAAERAAPAAARGSHPVLTVQPSAREYPHLLDLEVSRDAKSTARESARAAAITL